MFSARALICFDEQPFALMHCRPRQTNTRLYPLHHEIHIPVTFVKIPYHPYTTAALLINVLDRKNSRMFDVAAWSRLFIEH